MRRAGAVAAAAGPARVGKDGVSKTGSTSKIWQHADGRIVIVDAIAHAVPDPGNPACMTAAYLLSISYGDSEGKQTEGAIIDQQQGEIEFLLWLAGFKFAGEA